jgi:hypothetical protein
MRYGHLIRLGNAVVLSQRAQQHLSRRATPWAARDLHGASCRPGIAQHPRVDLVHRRKITEILQVHSRLHYARPVGARSSQHRREILQHALGLRLDPTIHDLTRRGSRAIWPAVKRRPPAITACEYGPIAAGAPDVETFLRAIRTAPCTGWGEPTSRFACGQSDPGLTASRAGWRIVVSRRLPARGRRICGRSPRLCCRAHSARLHARLRRARQ